MPSLIHKLLLFSGGAVAFSPSDISGLVAWYDASDATTLWEDSARTTPAADNADVIGAWDDKSGNGYHVIQATTGNKPTLRTNVQNSKPVIRTDGTDDYLAKDFGASYAQPNTLFIVANMKSASNDFMIDTPSGANRITVLNSGGTSMVFSAGSNLSVAQTLPTAMTIWRVKFNGASSSLYKNGALVASGAGGANPLTGLTLAARFNATLFGEIDFCEILAYNAALTGDEETAMEDYLNAKWAVY